MTNEEHFDSLDQNHKDFWITEQMSASGGNFVRILGSLFRHADPINQKRVKEAFPDYWEKYEEMARKYHVPEKS